MLKHRRNVFPPIDSQPEHKSKEEKYENAGEPSGKDGVRKSEKKLVTVITPDTWKDGARNTTESGGRKLNENKALTSKKARFDPYGKNKFSTCRICKSSVHQPGSHYCQGCAYKKGICAMCGKKVLDTKNYKQTSV